MLLDNPELLIKVSGPILCGFFVVLFFNIMLTKLTKLAYREAIITVIIGSSSHFEIAIATAISMYGVGSITALGTTMGLFWEIPIMVGMVYFGKYLNSKGFWEEAKPVKATVPSKKKIGQADGDSKPVEVSKSHEETTLKINGKTDSKDIENDSPDAHEDEDMKLKSAPGGKNKSKKGTEHPVEIEGIRI